MVLFGLLWLEGGEGEGEDMVGGACLVDILLPAMHWLWFAEKRSIVAALSAFMSVHSTWPDLVILTEGSKFDFKNCLWCILCFVVDVTLDAPNTSTTL